MTTNRMGLEQTLSDGYLEEIIRNSVKYGGDCDIEDMARELLAYRKASKEPIYQLKDWHWYDAEKHIYDEVTAAGGEGRIVYAAPPAPPPELPVYQYRIRNGYNGMVSAWQTINRDQVDFVLKAQPINAEFQIISPMPKLPESTIDDVCLAASEIHNRGKSRKLFTCTGCGAEGLDEPLETRCHCFVDDARWVESVIYTAPPIVPEIVPDALRDEIIDLCDGYEVGDVGAQEIWSACRAAIFNLEK